MVVNFDRNQNLTTDQKLQSLLESVQLALNEIDTRFDEISKAVKKLEEGN
jgi:chaperonin cofactor prefoldin